MPKICQKTEGNGPICFPSTALHLNQVFRQIPEEHPAGVTEKIPRKAQIAIVGEEYFEKITILHGHVLQLAVNGINLPSQDN